jgi:hypothetical protein
MMKKRNCLWLAIVATALATSVCAQESGSKRELTPAFWQRDPEAGFEDEGKMHCAPTAVSDGLIYLAKHKGITDLVPGLSHRNQIKLIKQLAEDFGTDPSIGGTNPDKIVAGLQKFAKAKGYELSRLEVKTWRRIRAANKKFKIGTKPDMDWMQEAVQDEDTIVIFNFGWYHEDGDDEESYTRKGAHWVAVLDTGEEDGEFIVHNPLLEPERQMNDTSVTLSLIDDDLTVINSAGDKNMKGYYEADGPGLPHGKTVKPILDAVIVFSLAK